MTITKDVDPDAREALDNSMAAEYRDWYHEHTGKRTTLTNDQILDMVARSDDDMDAKDWVRFMQAMEEGSSDKFAEEYNKTL